MAVIAVILIQKIITPFFTTSSNINNISSRISRTNLDISSPHAFINQIVTKPFYLLTLPINNSTKQRTLALTYFDYFSLPLFSLLSYFTVVPYLYLRMTSTYENFWQIIWHHSSNLEPFLFLSAVLAIKNLKSKLLFSNNIIEKISFGLIVMSVVRLTFVGYNEYLFFNLSPYINIYDELKAIPSDAKISASDSLVPHLANRTTIYQFPEIYDAEYLVIAKQKDTLPLSTGEYQEALNKVSFDKTWMIIKDSQSMLVYKKSNF